MSSQNKSPDENVYQIEDEEEGGDESGLEQNTDKENTNYFT